MTPKAAPPVIRNEDAISVDYMDQRVDPGTLPGGRVRRSFRIRQLTSDLRMAKVNEIADAETLQASILHDSVDGPRVESHRQPPA